jgi:hypothetical protein
MRRFAAAAIALAVFSLQPLALAQTPPPLMTLDAVGVGSYGKILVTGVADGESAPSTRIIDFTGSFDNTSQAREFCLRLLLAALNNPGQYKVRAGSNACAVVLVTP